MRVLLIGWGVALLVLALIGFAVIQMGWVPAAADQKPSKLERWAALHALHTAIRRESHELRDRFEASDDNLLKGARIYRANCLICHGAADGLPSAVARGLNIVPPQLAKDGVEDDPEGETYWKVRHGVRFTGMPAYTGSLSEDELWQVTLFVSHLSRLTAGPAAAWLAMPSAAEAPTH
jgi:mono/diheme cytochrome c family protein